MQSPYPRSPRSPELGKRNAKFGSRNSLNIKCLPVFYVQKKKNEVVGIRHNKQNKKFRLAPAEPAVKLQSDLSRKVTYFFASSQAKSLR